MTTTPPPPPETAETEIQTKLKQANLESQKYKESRLGYFFLGAFFGALLGMLCQ